MKHIASFLILSLALVLAGSARLQAQATGVTVTFNNTSGQALVLAFSQGLPKGKSPQQGLWLQWTGNFTATHWSVPTPQSNNDLKQYIFSIAKGETVKVFLPSYAADVGFRCLVAEPAYAQNAMVTSQGVKYMGFPDLMTSTLRFDKFEGGLTQGTPGIWNITAVDFVSIPMQLQMGNQTVGFNSDVSATQIFAALNKLPKPFSMGDNVNANATKPGVRWYSPAYIPACSTAMDSLIKAQLPALDPAADVTYGHHQFTQMMGSITSTQKGVVGQVTCYYTNKAIGVTTPTPITVDDVTSAKAFAGTIVGSGVVSHQDSAARAELGALLSAAICRGVLSQQSLWGDISRSSNCPYPWDYYPSGATCNLYSKVIHSYSIHARNYGFAYDDYFNDEAGFYVMPGDEVTVNILPINGNTAPVPNAPLKPATGCLSISLPKSTVYPSGSSWNVGPVEVEGKPLVSGNTQLCGLPSDTVHVRFPNFPTVSMDISMNPREGVNTVSWKDSRYPRLRLTGITGCVYDSAQRSLTFGGIADWQYANCLQVSLPPGSTSYPSAAALQVGPLAVAGEEMMAGANSVCQPIGNADTAWVAFGADPLVKCWLDLNSAHYGFQDMTGNFGKVTGVSGMVYAQNQLTFGAGAQFQYAQNLVPGLPSTYPSGNGWGIGALSIQGQTLQPGINVPFITSDSLTVSFSAQPSVTLLVKADGSYTFYQNGKPNPRISIPGMVVNVDGSGNVSLSFGAAASFSGVGKSKRSPTR